MKLRDRVDVLNADDLPTDEHGNPVPDWTGAPFKREPAEISPLSSTEYTLGQDTTVSRFRILLGRKTAADNESRIRWRSHIYEVIGEVQPVPDQRARISHHEAILERVA